MNPKSVNEILADKNAYQNKNIDKVSDTVMYVGLAKPTGTPISDSSSVWLIKKITITGSVISIRLAENTDTYTLIWDNRTTYTY